MKKYNIPNAPSNGFSGTQFSTLIVLETMKLLKKTEDDVIKVLNI
jgi:hypothetical protein